MVEEGEIGVTYAERLLFNGLLFQLHCIVLCLYNALQLAKCFCGLYSSGMGDELPPRLPTLQKWAWDAEGHSN